MWKSILLGLAISAVFTSSAIAQSCISYPNPLTNGTPANGSDVIGDMTYMSGCLAPLASPQFSGQATVMNGTVTAAFQVFPALSLQPVYGGQALFFNGSSLLLGSMTNDGVQPVASVASALIDGGSGTTNYAGALTFATKVETDSAPVVKMILTQDGAVGIDTTSPSYTLHVNGSVAGTSAYNNLSDERLKKDIRPITGALALVERLSGVRFEWRSAAERTVGKSANLPVGKAQVGFIAQDVEKVLPEAVSTAKGPEAIKSVAESKVVPVLVEALKELKASNDNQAAEIGHLKTEMSALERKVRVQTAQR